MLQISALQIKFSIPVKQNLPVNIQIRKDNINTKKQSVFTVVRELVGMFFLV